MVTNICFGGADMRTAYITLSCSGRLLMVEDWPVPGLRLNYQDL
jgi:gluconolactonase